VSRLDWRIWDEETCAHVHEAALQVLAETGVAVRHERALELLGNAGAKVEGALARIPRQLVQEALVWAPDALELKARGAHEPLLMDAAHSYYGTGSDCLCVRDPDTGARRRTRCADIEGMSALSELLPNIEFVMSMGLPEDVPQAIDDLAQFAAMLKGTRKPILLSARDGRILPVMKEMAAICGEERSYGIYAMPAPPLAHEREAVDKIITCAQLQLPLVYASAPAAGATAPMSRAGVTIVGNAEVLSGLVIHQLTAPGAPFVYGVAQGALSMRTGSELYCAPEAYAVQHAGCDLARHYGLPSFTVGGCSDAKLPDEQWAAEAAVTLILGALSRATLIHDLGFLESGLQSSYEAIVFCAELVGFARSFETGIPVDDEALALSEITEVGPAGTHLGRAYTRRHHRDYWQPSLLDQWGFSRWESQGATTLSQRLRERVADLRAQPRPFELSGEAVEGLEGLLTDTVAARST
jgi:trimethylamine---corrinoid protein Co-methyltransferase